MTGRRGRNLTCVITTATSRTAWRSSLSCLAYRGLPQDSPAADRPNSLRPQFPTILCFRALRRGCWAAMNCRNEPLSSLSLGDRGTAGSAPRFPNQQHSRSPCAFRGNAVAVSGGDPVCKPLLHFSPSFGATVNATVPALDSKGTPTAAVLNTNHPFFAASKLPGIDRLHPAPLARSTGHLDIRKTPMSQMSPP